MKILTMARRAFAVVVIACGVVAVPSVALAQDAGDVDNVTGISVEDATGALNLTPVQVTILTGLIMPFVLGILFKKVLPNLSSRLRGTLALVLAAVVALVERAILVDGSATFTFALVLDVGLVYFPQIATYNNVWKQEDSSGKRLL